jgi:hypothetical protein
MTLLTLRSRAGTYGSPPRQLFECRPNGPWKAPDGSRKRRPGTHRFAGQLPRLLRDPGICPHCDTEVARHQGPLLSRKYEFHLRLAAQALVDVGTGKTYTQAAQRARQAAGRSPYSGPDPNGALVAEWVDVFAPVLLGAEAETAWPETLLLDSTNFFITNTRTRQRSEAFNVFGLYGYPAGASRGRLWGLWAAHRENQATWAQALAYIEDLGRARTGELTAWTPPAMLLTDGAASVSLAAAAYWPGTGIGPDTGPGGSAPFHRRCEWHLRKNARAAMKLHRINGGRQYLMRRLDTAFKRDEGWAEFSERSAPFSHITAWRSSVQEQVDAQVSRRHLLPPHHTLAALDQVFERVKPMLARRAFCFRNQRRMNLLLGLMRLAELKRDDVDDYHQLLREAAVAGGGTIATQRGGYCTNRAYDLRP